MTKEELKKIEKELDSFNNSDTHNLNCRLIFIAGFFFALVLIIILFGI